MTKNKPFTEGTIVFETQSFVDWQEFDRLVTQPELAAIDSMEISEEEKKERKEEHAQISASVVEMMKQRSTEIGRKEFVFSGNIATADRTLGGKKVDEFLLYQLDEMKWTRYYFNHKGEASQHTFMGTPEAAVHWSQITNSVRVDSSDTKEILGFPCQKYYVEHAHVTDFGNDRKERTRSHYEIYVTEAIQFPFFPIDFAVKEKLFNGCALTIKYIDDRLPCSYEITHATNFSPNILKNRLEIPERFGK